MSKKKHFIRIAYDTPQGHYVYAGLIDEVLGLNGKPLVYPASLFKKAFGFTLPLPTTITIG